MTASLHLRAVVAACLLTLAFVAASPQEIVAQQQPQTTTPPVEDDESESVGLQDDVKARPRAVDPATILRTAKTIFVHSKTAFVKDSEVENALRKRKEFQAWGMVVTRDESQADLIIEVERKVFTKRFVFTVLEPRTLTVVVSGKARSIIFGKSIAHKVAEKFVRRVKPSRS